MASTGRTATTYIAAVLDEMEGIVATHEDCAGSDHTAEPILPLKLKGVWPKLATIAAFVFMGLWHNLSLGYAIWGFTHGILLANWPKAEPRGLLKAMSYAVTWVLVISLSYIANFGALA